MSFPPHIRVLAAVISSADRFLVCQRPAEKRHGGLWEFPGGKLEDGEGEFQAAARELMEELEVTVLEVGDPLFSARDAGSVFVIDFIPTTISGEPRCHEHQDLRWLSLDELVDIPLAPSDRAFVEFLRNRKLSSDP